MRERGALPLNQDRRARGLAPGEKANTSAVAAAFLSMRGASENVSKPQPTEPDERGDLYRFGSRSRRAGAGCGREGRVAGVETVVRERHEEGTESRGETEKRAERERPVDGTPSGTKQRERMQRERKSERERKREGGGGERGTGGSEAGRTGGRAAACLCLCFGK